MICRFSLGCCPTLRQFKPRSRHPTQRRKPLQTKLLQNEARWHCICLHYGREVETRLQPKSGRSKKGGAGTSVRLRKLRGRSTTSFSNGPPISAGRSSVRSPELSRSTHQQVAVRHQDPVLVGVEMRSGCEGDARKG